MPFPPPSGIKIDLNSATPTPFDADVLKAQLEAVGLNCSQLTPEFLQQSINQVTTQLPRGAIQTYGYKVPSLTPPVSLASVEPGTMRTLAQAVPPLTDTSNNTTGNWTIDPTGDGYASILEVIQAPDHFQWLWDNRATNGFTGTYDNPAPYKGNYPNAQAIEKLFVDVGTVASSTLVTGIDQNALTAALTNVIAPLDDASLSNYVSPDPHSLVMYLVDNYNPSTRYADGIGVLSINWMLTIQDYKRKTKDGGDTHATTLTIKAASVLYYDPAIMCTHYNSILKQFKIDPTTAPQCYG